MMVRKRLCFRVWLSQAITMFNVRVKKSMLSQRVPQKLKCLHGQCVSVFMFTCRRLEPLRNWFSLYLPCCWREVCLNN